MTDAKRVYSVAKIKSHVAMHGDELDAWMLGKMFGEGILPGFSRAPIELIDAGLHPELGHDGWYFFYYEATACLGVLGGPFDEHTDRASDGVRRNAATKMAEYVGVHEDPALARIFAYSLRADKDGKDTPFESASITKAWWSSGMKLEQVLRLYEMYFRAIYRRERGATAVIEVPEGGFKRVIAEWFFNTFAWPGVKNRFMTGAEAAEFFGKTGDENVAQILKFEYREGEFGHKSPFDLEAIWEAIVAAGKPAEAREFVLASLDALWYVQRQFIATVNELRAKGSFVHASAEQPYGVVLIRSDNEQMKRAARSEGTIDVLFQQRSTGRFNVFDLNQRLDMRPVAARLRIAERDAQGRKGYLAWEQLMAEGTIPEVPELFLFYGVHNGTLTAPNKAISKTTERGRMSAVLQGLREAYKRNPKVYPIARHRQIIKENRARKAAARVAKVAATSGNDITTA